jgi:hypothetical protein
MFFVVPSGRGAAIDSQWVEPKGIAKHPGIIHSEGEKLEVVTSTLEGDILQWTQGLQCAGHLTMIMTADVDSRMGLC